MTIQVIDSIMGSGKTEWAIHHMREHPTSRYIFTTPYLEQTNRIIRSCPELHICTPDTTATYGKTAHFQELLKQHRNIATSHELFVNNWYCTGSDEALIKDYGYELIIDEALEAVDTIKYSKCDIDDLIACDHMAIQPSGLIHWKNRDYTGRHIDLMQAAIKRSAFLHGEAGVIKTIPLRNITAFPRVTVLTYLFEGSRMLPFLSMNNIGVDYYHINAAHDLVHGRDHNAFARLKDMINIYDGPLNEIGNDFAALSATWWKSKKKGAKELQTKASNAAYNYLHNICKASVQDCLWTNFKDAAAHYPVRSYARGFIPCNMRASNDFNDRHHLVYLINWFEVPVISSWFTSQGIDIDHDAIALSNMLQWIWRSAIRKQETVQLFLPSKRMR